MENYLTIWNRLIYWIVDNISVCISLAAFFISVLTFIFSVRDRKNHVKIELLTDAEFAEKFCKDIGNHSFMEGWLYIVIRNTGRTNVYVDSVWCKFFPSAKEIEFVAPRGGVVTRNEFGKLTTTSETNSLILPFRSQIYFCSVASHSYLPEKEKFSVIPYAALQSGSIENGFIRYLKKEDLQ